MTSKHTFEESSNPLAKLDYIPLLDTILSLIKKKNIFKFSGDGNRLLIHAYDIAYTIATDSNLEQKSPLTQDIGIKAATVNFISETEFYSQIQAIRDELRKQLDDACGKNQTKACLEKLCTSLSNFNSNQPSLPFYYPFNKPSSFTSQRLTIENSLADERRKGSDSAIKAHHLNVRFEGISQFDNNLLDSLKLYIDNIATPDSEDWQELTELLGEISGREKSELTEIRKIVDTESLPRLLRDIKIDYLDYLKIECAKTNICNSNTEGFECLETLINRLRLLSDYINDPDLDNPHYEVSYLLDQALNLRTAFSQANAFDMLPIIAEYEGVIGESVDKERGIKEFNLGLRLKLNGSVNAYDEKSVLDYYMTELDPNSQRHQEQLKDPAKVKNFKVKVLIIACLYYFIFAVDEDGKLSDKDYNPIAKFEAEVINKLKPGATSDEEVRNVLCHIKNLILNQDGWRFICINTNKRILDHANGGYAVEYYSNKLHGDRPIGQVQFLDISILKDNVLELPSQLVRYADNLVQVEKRKQVGVLASLCEAIHTCIINPELPNNIIATASIQSLKETRYGNTLKHFGRIFSSAYNSSSKPPGIIPKKMKEIASRIKNIFIMIDEITGSQEGVAFLHGILEFIEEYDLINLI